VLNPAGTFNLAGTTTQGTTRRRKSDRFEYRNGPLHVTAIAVSGLNAGDFSMADQTA